MQLTIVKRASLMLLAFMMVAGCVVIPTAADGHVSTCEISSDRKTLRVLNVAKETNTYYSISGLVITPILVPATALISGTYVAVNNIYNFGEEKIKCGKE